MVLRATPTSPIPQSQLHLALQAPVPPTVDAPTVTPSIITQNTSTDVLATVRINDSRLLPGSVTLFGGSFTLDDLAIRAPKVVPEPRSFYLLLIGSVGFAALRRKI